VTTFIVMLDDPPAHGIRVAVKDCIDVAGVPSTWGSKAVADHAEPAPSDAACLAGVRAAGAGIVGKTNLHELCFGSTGVNPWFGTPRNPFGEHLVPGGSSSGSTVAVVTGEADVGIGTDTTGSVRTPAAWCGAVGLRTTHGRVPLGGVAPLAPSLDTVGPIARDVRGVALGMSLLDPGFTAGDAPRVVGRVRLGADPIIEAAVDEALAAAEVEVVEVQVPGWDAAVAAGRTILFGEAWLHLSHLYLERPDAIGAEVRGRFELARQVTAAQLSRAWAAQAAWKEELAGLLQRVQVLALPTHRSFPPPIEERDTAPNDLAVPAALASAPSLAMPVRTAGPIPASLQLLGAPGSEEALVALGVVVEAAAGWSHG